MTERDDENFVDSTLSETSEAISLLRQTIDKLQNIVTQLETKSIEDLPTNSLATLVDSTEKFATEIENLSPSRSPKIGSGTTEKVEDFAAKEAEEARSIASEIQTPPFGKKRGRWGKFLLQVRGFLPSSISDALPDNILTSILASVAVIFIFVSVNLLPSSNVAPPQVSENVPIPTEPPSEPTEITAPTLDFPTIEPTAEPEAKPTETPRFKDKSLPLELTPEQSLIASIQGQVADITDRYSTELITAIEADFLGSRLFVTVTDKWQELRVGRQEKLANEMLDRARRLDFNKLEIIDANRRVLARSPVVGNKMVLLN